MPDVKKLIEDKRFCDEMEWFKQFKFLAEKAGSNSNIIGLSKHDEELSCKLVKGDKSHQTLMV